MELDNFTDNSLLVRALFEGQREMSKKIDNLHADLIRHMESENSEITELKVDVATLKEKASGFQSKWGFVGTVVASMLSALGVGYLSRHQ